jgi:hypothetical protein
MDREDRIKVPLRTLRKHTSEWRYDSTSYDKYDEQVHIYRGADKSLARPTSRCILFDG